jgi:hypothetical protein
MKPGKIVCVVAGVLAIATLACVTWRVRAIDAGRLALRRQVADAQSRWDAAVKGNAELQRTAAELRLKRGGSSGAQASAAATSQPVPAQGAPVLDPKKVQAAQADAQRKFVVQAIVRLELNLRPEFERLGLSPEQWDQYEKLIVNREPEAKVREAIGEAASDALKKYQEEKDFRTEVRRLADDLRFSTSPVTPAQAEQLVQVTRDSPSVLNDPDGAVPDAAMARIREILSPAQVAAWLQLHEAHGFGVQFSQAALEP